MRRLRALFGNTAGNVMVEFALGSTILVSAFTATFQYGYIFYQYNSLFNAVNNGAHYAALAPYDASCATYSDTYGNAVKNMVVYGDPTGTTTTPLLTGLSASNVTITMGPTGGTCNSVASTYRPTSVSISIAGYTINSVFGTFTLAGKPSVKYIFQGLYTPPTT